jgi:hypothetical protein
MVALVKELQTPSSRPATGSSAMGSIKERPTRCKTPKILSFIVILQKKVFVEIYIKTHTKGVICILRP